jgi:TonB family protein
MRDSLALPVSAVALACGLSCAAMAPRAFAQAAAPAPSASNADANERASREGDKVFKWILMHSDKPRKPVKEAAPPAKEAPAREAKSPAPAEPAPKTAATRAADKPAPQAAAPVAAASPAAKPAASAAPVPFEPPATQTAALAKSTAGAPPPPEDEGDEPLVLKSQVDPEFPGALVRNLRKGTVQVKFSVQPDGKVEGVEVVKTTNARLNQAAMNAVQQWRFQPLRHAQMGIVELGFNLD